MYVHVLHVVKFTKFALNRFESLGASCAGTFLVGCDFSQASMHDWKKLNKVSKCLKQPILFEVPNVVFIF